MKAALSKPHQTIPYLLASLPLPACMMHNWPNIGMEEERLTKDFSDHFFNTLEVYCIIYWKLTTAVFPYPFFCRVYYYCLELYDLGLSHSQSQVLLKTFLKFKIIHIYDKDIKVIKFYLYKVSDLHFQRILLSKCKVFPFF